MTHSIESQDLDAVFIRKLELFMQIGCRETERAVRQKVRFDVDIKLNASVAAASGELGDSICYVSVKQLISEIALSKQWVLVEQLGQNICDSLLSQYPRAQSVRLSVTKYIVEGTGGVGITFRRTRG